MFSEEQILSLIEERVDHPATVKELLQVLHIPADQRQAFKRRLQALVAAGRLVEIRGERYGLPDRMNLVVGRISTNPRGFAFVDLDPPMEGGPASIYIAGNNLNQAMHGDRVVVRIESPAEDGPTSVYIAGGNLNQAMHGDRAVVRVEHTRSGDRAEGRIVRILERAAQRIVGRYDLDGSGQGFVVPFDRRLLMDVQVPPRETQGAAPGEMVALEITRWPTATRPPLGRISEVLGRLEAAGVDTAVIIYKYGLPDAHSAAAVAEATRLGTAVRDKDRHGRTDFRQWETVTIDGEHARDFDDAISIDRLPNGNFWLAVHIADVAHYVTAGSALDTEA